MTIQCGTYAGWNKHQRDKTPTCGACRAAKAKYARESRWAKGGLTRAEWNAERHARTLRDRTHGTNGMYHAGCRCDICRAWNRGYMAGYHGRLAKGETA